MDPIIPITRDEAMRYDRAALAKNIDRLKGQVTMFQGEISKLESEINRLYQIIAVIDATK